MDIVSINLVLQITRIVSVTYWKLMAQRSDEVMSLFSDRSLTSATKRFIQKLKAHGFSGSERSCIANWLSVSIKRNRN